MSAAEHIVRVFGPLLVVQLENIDQLGTATMPFPIFPVDVVQALVEEAIIEFQKMPNVLYLEGSMYVVGDIHGNIKDLLRIFATGGYPGNTRYLFLGDYIDRGQFSVEVIILLLALACTYREAVCLLRGNHEYEHVNAVYGFKEQILCLYGNQKLYSRFQDLFSHFPIAAVVNDNSFCVHGGLSPYLKDIHQLDSLDRSALTVPRIITDMMWSDPSHSLQEFQDSERGSGCQFGVRAVTRFLSNNGLRRIIRAHQFQEKGIQKMFDGKVVTVFSTSNYKSPGSNRCGIVRVIHNEEKQIVQAFNLDAANGINRNDAHFWRVNEKPIPKPEKTFDKLRCLSRSGSLMTPQRMPSRNARPIIRPVVGAVPLRKVTSLTGSHPTPGKLKSQSQKDLPDANRIPLTRSRAASMESFGSIFAMFDESKTTESVLVPQEVPLMLTGSESTDGK